MPRRRSDQHLPPCVYHKNGAYWLVKKNKWTRLGKDLPAALAEYGRIIQADKGAGMEQLLRDTLDRAAARVKPRTLEQYETAARHITAAFVEFAPEQVRATHIAQFLDHLRDKPNMANRCRSVLKLAFDLAVLRGEALTNPVTSVPRHSTRARKRYLTDGEYRAIHAAASPIMQCIMDMCYLTAQRVGDVLRIHASDITQDGILFRPEKTTDLTGEGKALLVAMTPDLAAVIARARALHGEVPRLLLFGQKRGGKLRSYRGVRDLFDRAAGRAAVADAHLHDLRAKSLTDAKRQGLDPQALALHSSESMTRRYIRDREIATVQGPSLRQLIDSSKKDAAKQ